MRPFLGKELIMPDRLFTTQLSKIKNRMEGILFLAIHSLPILERQL
jgi:hypothetical protein